MKILIVEDEDDIRDLLVRMAEAEGHEAQSAADGAEAMRLIDAETFDLIMLDLALPIADGVTVAKHLRAREEVTGQRPAYVMGNTGFGAYVIAAGTFERAGIDELREKPLEPAAIVELMRVLASQRQEGD